MGKLRSIVIVGAGGFAREVRWLIDEINRREPTFRFVGYVVSDPGTLAETDAREDVVGDLAWLRSRRDEIDAVAIGIGTPAVRLRIAGELAADFAIDAWPALVHPGVLSDLTSCRFAAGSVVCAAVVCTVNVSVGEWAVVNLGCTLGHEAVVGRGSVLNPGVNVSGGVVVGEGVLIGTGAQLLQYLSIGAGATVGAGAVVTRDVPPGITVVGVPAKALITK